MSDAGAAQLELRCRDGGGRTEVWILDRMTAEPVFEPTDPYPWNIRSSPAIAEWSGIVFGEFLLSKAERQRHLETSLPYKAYRWQGVVHRGERDRGMRPYRQHPIAVSIFALEAMGKNPELCRLLDEQGFSRSDVVTVLLLHDVIEHRFNQEREAKRLELAQMPEWKNVAVKKIPLDDAMMEEIGFRVLQEFHELGYPQRIEHAVLGLTYLPNSERLTAQQKIQAHAEEIRSSEVAKLLKPFDLAHNLQSDRLWPAAGQSAQQTVVQVWKYVQICDQAGILPYGFSKNFSQLGSKVLGLPYVREIIGDPDGWSEFDPKKLDDSVFAEFPTNPTLLRQTNLLSQDLPVLGIVAVD